MFERMQKTYYNEIYPTHPIKVRFEDFIKRPLFVFDCTKTDESIKAGMVDVRIEIQAKDNLPALTSAYCLIIHDNLVWYSPFTGIVHRDV